MVPDSDTFSVPGAVEFFDIGNYPPISIFFKLSIDSGDDEHDEFDDEYDEFSMVLRPIIFLLS